MKKDFHMHTFLSDGTPSPEELVRVCLDLQLDEISITDHDSIGSYPAVLELVKGTKLRITPGAELDCVYGELDIHMLGLNLDIHNSALKEHLSWIQAARKKRAMEQAEAINQFYGKPVVDLERIFARCETFMAPHLIHTMIDQGYYDQYQPPDRYKQAQTWMKEHIKVKSEIQKPTVERIFEIIHDAKGIAVLAHPGYYLKNGHNVEEMIRSMKDMGMDGLEVTYPYFQEGSREFPTLQHEAEALTILREIARRYNLIETTGSDAHQVEQLRSFHNRS